jgi:NADH-quinone oxidoreductase subunit E
VLSEGFRKHGFWRGVFLYPIPLPSAGEKLDPCLSWHGCHVQGGKQLSEEVEKTFNIRSGETTPDGKFDFQEVACLGCCAQAPVVEMNGKIYGKMTPAQLSQILRKYDPL